MIFKKILFPFYKKERHIFLIRKWWFRLIIVAYIVLFVATPFIFFSNYMEAYDWCYKSSSYLYQDNNAFDTALANCSQAAREAWTPAIITAIFGTLIIHYLIQLIFFKIVINYIVMGGVKRNDSSSSSGHHLNS